MTRSAAARLRRSAPGSRAHAAAAARVRDADVGDSLSLALQAARLARCAAARLPSGHPAIPGCLDAAVALEAALAASRS